MIRIHWWVRLRIGTRSSSWTTYRCAHCGASSPDPSSQASCVLRPVPPSPPRPTFRRSDESDYSSSARARVAAWLDGTEPDLSS